TLFGGRSERHKDPRAFPAAVLVCYGCDSLFAQRLRGTPKAQNQAGTRRSASVRLGLSADTGSQKQAERKNRRREIAGRSVEVIDQALQQRLLAGLRFRVRLRLRPGKLGLPYTALLAQPHQAISRGIPLVAADG